MMAHAYNPETFWESDVGGSLEARSSRPGWATYQDHVSSKKKISWAWWCVPIVPAAREAESVESLEPRRQKLQ